MTFETILLQDREDLLLVKNRAGFLRIPSRHRDKGEPETDSESREETGLSHGGKRVGNNRVEKLPERESGKTPLPKPRECNMSRDPV
jgi:hypothetical protein